MEHTTTTGAPHLSSLDQALLEALHPLRKADLKLRVPFFANTFPLAYHYFQLLGSIPEIDDRISFIPWGHEETLIDRWSGAQPLLCYTTSAVLDRLKAVQSVMVTTFQPCWIFTEFNLGVWLRRTAQAKADKCLPDEVQFSSIAPILKQMFQSFEVFTEMEEQANHLFASFFEPDQFKVVTEKRMQLLLGSEHLTKNTLRVFLYGAPITSYFLRKKQRYIPFRLGEIPRAPNIQSVFKTAVAVRGLDEANASEIMTALGKYHAILYSSAHKASSQNLDSFRSVQYAYNRTARLIQHRSSFPNSVMFADCLRHHHRPSSP